MTITIPTATSIKLRFPEFTSIDDGVIEFAIERARLDVDDDSNWTRGADVALSYLVAHYVAAAKAAATSGGSGGSGAVVSRSIGRLSLTYAQSQQSKVEAVADDKESTSYGREYLALVGANFSGPLIV